MRVAVSSRFLPHYRCAFFDYVARELEKAGSSLDVYFNFTLGPVKNVPSWAHRVPAVRRDIQIGELEEYAVFGPGLFWQLVRRAPDVLVLEDIGGLPNSLLGALFGRLWRRPYLVWGLGNVPEKKRSHLRRTLAPLIGFLYEGAAGFICYSEHAADIYRAYGKPTYVAPNSYLPPLSGDDYARLQHNLHDRYEARGLRVASIGTLKMQKRYDELLIAVARLPEDTTLDLVGDGPAMGNLQRLANDLGIAGRVTFHGAQFDREAKRQILERAHIGVIPGRGGLAIQEMMAYGLPVVCGVADGTERDLIVDGANGYLLDGFPSADAISTSLATFAALTASQKQHFAQEALDTVTLRSNIVVMADGFLRGVRDVVHA
jgi:glycosyltransferase involved in cell wall biosynthesis